MAKKKRRRHRRPVAPPVHSAPGTVHGPAGPPPTQAPPGRPFTPEPPAVGETSAHTPASTPARPRDVARRKAVKRRRRGGRLRTYLIVAGIIVLIVAAVVGRQILNSRRTSNFNELASANGCGRIETTSRSGEGQHLAEGQTARYDSSPPTHGPHALGALTAGIYDDPFTNVLGDRPTIYQAVHSLEHGYIIVWHDGLTTEQERTLERRYRDERKVIVVPYPQLRGDTKMALTAWGFKVECEQPNTRVIDSFTDLYREARSAPESKGV
jgi:hypothetical protein